MGVYRLPDRHSKYLARKRQSVPGFFFWVCVYEERRMNTERATPEVIDALAAIEAQRQEKEKESGVPASCNWALGKLYELLPGERRSRGLKMGASLQANIEAATLAIGQLRKLAQATGGAARRDGRWKPAPARRSGSSSSSSP